MWALPAVVGAERGRRGRVGGVGGNDCGPSRVAHPAHSVQGERGSLVSAAGAETGRRGAPQKETSCPSQERGDGCSAGRNSRGARAPKRRPLRTRRTCFWWARATRAGPWERGEPAPAPPPPEPVRFPKRAAAVQTDGSQL